MKEAERTSNAQHDHPVYKAFASGDNDRALAGNVVEYLEKRFTSIEVKIEDDYLAERIAQEVMKNNNELYKKFSDEMRVQNEKFSDEIREHSEKFNDAMREQNAKFNDTIRSHNAKFNDEMRAQNKEFNDEIREQSEKFNAAMLAQNEKFYSKLQMHTYWTVGTILASAVVIIALLQL